MSRHGRLAAFIFAGAALVGAGFWGGTLLPTSTATPQALTGTVREVGGGGDEFAILLSGTNQATSYGFSDSIPWRDAQGTWNSSVGVPIACMKPLSHGQQITFGVINAKPAEGASGGPAVVWIECAS